MKKIKKYLSLMLVAAILLSSLVMGFGQVKTAALVTKTPTSNPITFYVPELIYLTAAAGKASSFQYYVDSNTSGTPDNSKSKTSGVVYFNSDNATNVSITCLGASVTLGSSSSASSTLSTTITAGTLLTGISQGEIVTLPWTVTYTVQGQAMTATAYTVCYAPPVEAIGVNNSVRVTQTLAGRYKADLQGLFYVSGVQGYSSGGNAKFNQTGDNIKLVCPMLGIVTDPAGTDSQFAEWYTSSTNSGVRQYENNNATDKRVENRLSPTGLLTVDTSRYNDINQIPNYTCGMVLYNVWNLQDLGYYICDFEGEKTPAWITTDDGSSSWSDLDLVYLNSLPTTPKFLVGNTVNSQTIKSGIVYGGTNGGNVYSNPISGTGTYNMRLKGAARGIRQSTALCISNLINVTVTMVDKGDLRNKIRLYTNYGLQREDFTGVTWVNYENALAEAAVRLGNPKSQDASTSNLMSAYNALVKQQYTATITHAATDGKFSDKETVLVFNSGDTVTASKRDSYTGYSCSTDTKTWYASHTNITYTFSYTPNTYTLTFDPLGGTASTTTSTVTYNSMYGAGTGGFPTPTRAGYVFDGWFTGAGGTGSKVLVTTAYTTAGNATLYAKWSSITYTILYNVNGTGTTGSTAPSTHTYDVSNPLTTNGFVRPGFFFQGWATTPNPQDLTFLNGESVLNLAAVNGSVITLYAIWSSSAYTVRYNGNGATGGFTTNSNHYYGQPKNLTLNGFVKTGYTFAGWSAIVGGPIVFNNGESVLDLTEFGLFNLYAVWTATAHLKAKVGSTTLINYVDHWIYGLEPGISVEAFKNDFVTLTGNTSLVITSSTGAFGTGTKVEVVDNDTQAVLETYTVIIFGDVNGDGNIDNTDAGRLADIENHIIIRDPIADAAYIKAGDLNGEGNLDSVDAGIIADASNYKAVLDQTTGLVKI